MVVIIGVHFASGEVGFNQIEQLLTAK